jgi:hypothetical protein
MGTWEEWRAPGAVVGIIAVVGTIFGMQLSSINARLDAIDKQYSDVSVRITQQTSRIDTVNAQMVQLSAQVGGAQHDIAYIRARVDKVAEKLQIGSLEPGVVPRAPIVGEEKLRKGSITAPTGSNGDSGIAAPAIINRENNPFQFTR